MKSEVVTDNKMINRLKVVLAEKNRTGKWLAQQLVWGSIRIVHYKQANKI